MYRIGFSKDVHKLIYKEKKVKNILGNTIFLSNYKIIAESDGDIIIHSLAESILSAIGYEDIGTYFKNEKFSINILKFALEKLKSNNYEIVNVVLLVVCEKIYISRYKKRIKINLNKILNTFNITLNATRFENKENGYIEVYSNILIKKI